MKPLCEEELRRLDAPGLRLLVARGYEERVVAEGLASAHGFDVVMATARRVQGGRSSNRILESDRGSIRLRPSRHGGVLGNWLGNRFLFPYRPFRELRIWTALRKREISLPIPVLAVSRRRGLFWHSAFGSIDRGKAWDAAEWLETRPNDAELRAASVEFARVLRRFHDAGGLHGDLHVRNVLIETDDGSASHNSFRCTLIDLDRTRIVRNASPRQRMREIMRFARSLEKAGRPEMNSIRLCALTLSAYCDRDRRLRRQMLRWGPLEALRVRPHRLGWWIGDQSRRISELARR